MENSPTPNNQTVLPNETQNKSVASNGSNSATRVASTKSVSLAIIIFVLITGMAMGAAGLYAAQSISKKPPQVVKTTIDTLPLTITPIISISPTPTLTVTPSLSLSTSSGTIALSGKFSAVMNDSFGFTYYRPVELVGSSLKMGFDSNTIKNTNIRIAYLYKKTNEPVGEIDDRIYYRKVDYPKLSSYVKNGLYPRYSIVFEATISSSSADRRIAKQVIDQMADSVVFNNKAMVNPDAIEDNEGLPVTGKPVIYLYPTKPQSVSVKLNIEGDLTYTYPDYLGSWNVYAFPDGILVNSKDNKEYSYLFWEALQDIPVNFDRSFVVAGSDTREFLQTTLAKIGLTPKEYNEFIVFWYPILAKNKYNQIYFAGDEYVNRSELIIDPKPDSILRVYMVYRPLDQLINTTPQEIEPFIRKGFTVVEWGGRKID